MKKILSGDNNYIKELLKLHKRKYREQRRSFLLEGYHLISEAKTGKFLKQVLITNESDFVEGVENILVSEAIIKKLAFTITPQPIIGVCEYFPDYELIGERFLLLDDIQDPGNLGTLVRTSLGFGIDMVILGSNSVDIYNDKFIRGSQGSVFKTKVIKRDLLNTIDVLKAKDIYIIGTSLLGKPLQNLEALSKYALILGNEGRGVDEKILSKTNINVLIETRPRLESLNVAIAGGIIMHHLDKN
ncbi:MAG: RNA methyltransferase [Bacilli bacterium]|nr:RNA methyltransferase [Bacilli bacterium]